MAAGFMCMLGGSLLCVLPFGFTQTLGVSFIIGGAGLIFAGSSEGERPYHLDTETGQKTPIVPPNSGSGIGVGTQF